MKNSLFFLIVFSLFAFFSCKHTAPKECRVKLDSLRKELDVFYKDFKAHSFDEYKEIRAQVKKTNSVFKEHVFNIKDNTLKTKFSQYADIEKEYKRIFKRYDNIAKEFEISLLQLDHLKRDMETGALYEKEKIDIYIQQERLAIQYLAQKVKELYEDAERQKHNFLITKDEVERFYESISLNRPPEHVNFI